MLDRVRMQAGGDERGRRAGSVVVRVESVKLAKPHRGVVALVGNIFRGLGRLDSNPISTAPSPKKIIHSEYSSVVPHTCTGRLVADTYVYRSKQRKVAINYHKPPKAKRCFQFSPTSISVLKSVSGLVSKLWYRNPFDPSPMPEEGAGAAAASAGTPGTAARGCPECTSTSPYRTIWSGRERDTRQRV